MICASCKENKNEVHPRKSRVAPGMTLLKCRECIDLKREPRYLIILYGRKEGFEYVSDFIKGKRYVGEEILASELLN